MTESAELFSTRMRKATRKIHSVSDALVNAKFALSLQDETVWGGGLFVFYHIFAFLEDAKERLNMPEMNTLFVHDILYRKTAFEKDLTHYLGEDWRSIRKSSALENYIDHLQYLEKENPTLLLAYVYHLYLGLLSGGQILSKKRNMFGGKENAYKDNVTDFTNVDISKLKNDFRSAMNSIASKMTPEQLDALIEESNQVFLMNNLVVNSVTGQNQVMWNMFYKASAFVLLFAGAIWAIKVHKA